MRPAPDVKGDSLAVLPTLPPTISPVDPLVNRDPSNRPKVPEAILRFPAPSLSA